MALSTGWWYKVSKTVNTQEQLAANQLHSRVLNVTEEDNLLIKWGSSFSRLRWSFSAAAAVETEPVNQTILLPTQTYSSKTLTPILLHGCNGIKTLEPGLNIKPDTHNNTYISHISCRRPEIYQFSTDLQVAGSILICPLKGAHIDSLKKKIKNGKTKKITTIKEFGWNWSILYHYTHYK